METSKKIHLLVSNDEKDELLYKLYNIKWDNETV